MVSTLHRAQAVCPSTGGETQSGPQNAFDGTSPWFDEVKDGEGSSEISHDGNPKQFIVGDAAARPRQFAVRCCHRLYRTLREDSRCECRGRLSGNGFSEATCGRQFFVYGFLAEGCLLLSGQRIFWSSLNIRGCGQPTSTILK